MGRTDSRAATAVDVGTPPSGFRTWDSTEVCFHGFADLTMAPGSPDFTCLGRRWMLQIYLSAPTLSTMVSVHLWIMSGESIKMSYSFSVRNSSGKVIADFSECAIFDTEADLDTGWGIVELAKRATLMEALVEGTLTIEVRMKENGQPKCSLPAFVPENPIFANILKKFMDQESADVVFKLGGDVEKGQTTHESERVEATASPAVFHAHRLILEAGAPELADMCCGSALGGDSTVVPITGVGPDLFQRVLYYVYGGKVSDEELKENAKDLIDAADRFGVVGLKLEAEACYAKTTALSVGNVLDNLLYADSKNCALLKEAAMDYIVENRADVMNNVSFANAPGALMTDLLAALGRDEGGDGASTRVSTLRKKLHEKGLDVDGSREAMVKLLEENP